MLQMLNSEEILYKTGPDIDEDQLINLYNSVNWSAYTNAESKPHLLRAICNSTSVSTAWVGDKLVGLARGLSDDVSIFYLQDILVKPAFQNKGVGTELLKRCLKPYLHVRSKVILTDDDEQQHCFYSKLGFRNIKDMKSPVLNTFVKFRGE